MIQKLLILALIAVAFVACKKEEPSEPEEQKELSQMEKHEQALMAHPWRYFGEFYLLTGDDRIGYPVPNCLLDDSMVYLNDSKYLKFPQSELCPNQMSVADTLTWEVLSDSIMRTINQGIATLKKILILNEDSLMYSTV
ncbi:hypothetical protein GYB22_12725, partial [bacterium]|nr:hypothetical protein [bacterium]